MKCYNNCKGQDEKSIDTIVVDGSREEDLILGDEYLGVEFCSQKCYLEHVHAQSNEEKENKKSYVPENTIIYPDPIITEQK